MNQLYLVGLLIALMFIITIAIHVAIMIYSKSQFRPYIFFASIPLYLMLWGVSAWYMVILSLIFVILSLLLIKRDGINIGKELCSKLYYAFFGIIFISLLFIAIVLFKGFNAWIDNLYADIFSMLFN